MVTVMRNIDVEIVGGSSFSRYEKISGAKTYNCMVTDGALTPFLGYKAVKQIESGNNETRALFHSTLYDHLIAVIGNNVYEISSPQSYSKIGELNTYTGSVYIAENLNKQIGITDGTQTIYVYNYGDSPGFTKNVQDFNLGYLDSQNGWLITVDPTTDAWYTSDFDATNWTTGVSAQLRMEKSDKCVAAVVLGQQVWVLGKKSGTVWLPTPTVLTPYQQVLSLNLSDGCINPRSIAVGTNYLAWLAFDDKTSPNIVVTTGGQPQKITTDGIDFEINRLSNPEDCSAFLIEDTHTFYVITFPSDNVSFAYDFDEKKFYNLTDDKLDYFIASHVSFFKDKYYFLSYRDAKLYELGSEFTTYDGNIVPRIRITPHLRMPDASYFVTNDISITMSQGQSENTQRLDFSVSKDGGVTYGTIPGKELNALGNRINRMRFFRLGRANDLVMQFRLRS
jgi:hypothetical protein